MFAAGAGLGGVVIAHATAINLGWVAGIPVLIGFITAVGSFLVSGNQEGGERTIQEF